MRGESVKREIKAEYVGLDRAIEDDGLFQAFRTRLVLQRCPHECVGVDAVGRRDRTRHDRARGDEGRTDAALPSGADGDCRARALDRDLIVGEIARKPHLKRVRSVDCDLTPTDGGRLKARIDLLHLVRLWITVVHRAGEVLGADRPVGEQEFLARLGAFLGELANDGRRGRLGGRRREGRIRWCGAGRGCGRHVGHESRAGERERECARDDALEDRAFASLHV